MVRYKVTAARLRSGATLALLAILFASSISPSFARADTVQAESVTVVLQAPPCQVVAGGDDPDQALVAGFDPTGLPGDPLLPDRVYNVALPPDAILSTVALHVVRAETVDLPGAYDIPPAPPSVAWSGDEQIVDWGPNAATIVDGRNTAVYGVDAFFPASQVHLAGLAQMRKWRYARLLFTPLQYDPVSGGLRQATEVEVQITFQRRPQRGPQALAELSDGVMDARAAQILYNYDQARPWYGVAGQRAPAASANTYAIITTNQIVAASTRLDEFVAHKEAQGFTVQVVTEDEYGALTGQAPNGRAEKIRRWLVDHYLASQIEYVLLIGNPDPDDPEIPDDSVGDLPMKMCWPRHSQSTHRQSPTDYFYADLTGNWDLDGDGYFGEHEEDGGPGGVDFAADLYVGRIPVYQAVADWRLLLDGILLKTIDYENAPDRAWRRSALLPMSFFDASTDGAEMGERMKHDYLLPKGYATYTLYQQGPACSNSRYASDETLLDRAVRERWRNHPYGLVAWQAHGSDAAALIGYSSCRWMGALLETSDTAVFDDNHPAFVFQGSCNNGYPEGPFNLGTTLLQNGAVGTFSASRVSWYTPGPSAAVPGHGPSIGSLLYYVTQQLARGRPAGRALYDESSAMVAAGNTDWMNLMDFNLYGDPAVSTGLCDDLNEPNDSRQAATPLALGASRADLDICPAGDVDYYAFSGQAGQRIAAGVEAQALGSALDAHLALLDPAGLPLAASDDFHGQDPHLDYTLPADGTYYLEVRAADQAGGTGGDYFYTLSLHTVASLPFEDGFESGILEPAWLARTTADGRVRVSQDYAALGAYAVLFDDERIAKDRSSAALVLTIDLSAASDVALDFYWRSFNWGSNTPRGAVLLSNDWGATWATALELAGYQSQFVPASLDLDAAAAAHGLALNDHFQVQFRFDSGGSIPDDGYALDDVRLWLSPSIELAPSSLEETMSPGSLLTRSLTIGNAGQGDLVFSLAEADRGSVPREFDAGGGGGAPQETTARRPGAGPPAPSHPELKPQNSGGPDPFGYTFRDSREPGGPAYRWLEIAPPAGGAGTELASLAGRTWTHAWPVALPFAFPFYGARYGQLAVHTDGALAFEDRSMIDLDPAPIPGPNNSGVETFIASLWSRLIVDPGAVYVQDLGSLFVVEYYQVSGFPGESGPATWQVVLFPNGSLLFQYQDIVFGSGGDYGAAATVGIQGDLTTGLQYAYEEPALSDGLAICFAPPGQPPDCTSDLLWLSATPASGVVAPGAQQQIDVVLDAGAAGVAPLSEYRATLVVRSDDPGSPHLVPITMTVPPPASWGKLQGTVSGLGHCDGNPAPLAGAEVQIGNSDGLTWTLETDQAGTYSLWLDAASSPLTVTASYTGHQTVRVAAVPLAAQETTTQDLGLRWLQPCLMVAPSSLAVALPPGRTRSEGLTLANWGAAPANVALGGFRVLLVDDNGRGGYPTWYDARPYFQSALDGLEVDYDLFEAEAADGPPAAQLKRYPAVLWFSGNATNEGYGWPLAGPSAMDEVHLASYLDGGGSLFLSSNHYLMDAGQVTPFMQSYLGLDQRAETADLPAVSGVPGDPVGGSFGALALSYPQPPGWPPFRLLPGAAASTAFVDGDGVAVAIDKEANYRTVFFSFPWEAIQNEDPASGQAVLGAVLDWFGRVEDAPWLSTSPTSTVVPADGHLLVQVLFDATLPEVAGLGRYTTVLFVHSDDPVNSLIRLPLSMEVANFGLDLAPAAGAQAGDPGAGVTYTLRLTNTGTTSDIFDVVTGGHAWLTAVAGNVGPLAVGQGAALPVTVTIPAGAPGGATDTVTVTVTSKSDDRKSAAASLTTTAECMFDLALAPAAATQPGLPGDTVVYELTLTNQGNATDTFDVTIGGHAWPVSAPAPLGPLAAGEELHFAASVRVPVSAPAGASDTAALIVTSQGDESKRATATLTTRVPFYARFLPLVLK